MAFDRVNPFKRGASSSPKEAGPAPSQDDIASLFSRAASGNIDKSLITDLTNVFKRSLKVSKNGISVSGQGLGDLLLKIAPKIPVRTAEELRTKSGGMTGESLAGYHVKRASRHSAAIGGLAGGLASASSFVPPAWIMFPAEVLVETILIASIEMKLVAELHEIYGQPITGNDEDRGMAILHAWSERRGFDPENAAILGIGSAASKGARTKLVHLIRRKLLARAARNISTIAPMLIGAVAAAEINRRATSDLGNALVRDLGKNIIDTKLSPKKLTK